MTKNTKSRRVFVSNTILTAAALFAAPSYLRSASAAGDTKELSFHHLHTDEKVAATYWANGTFDASACAAIDHVLRDWRRNEAVPIDRNLLNMMHWVHQSLGTAKPFQVICGYRAPATNADLRSQGRGVAKRSLHMQGKAIDIAVSGVGAKDLHRAAVSLKAGGVGLYSKSGFVHMDTGRVRYWGA